MVDTIFPYGRRGERPVFIPANVDWERQRVITEVPGVIAVTGGFQCTWDIAWAVAALVGAPIPELPLSSEAEYHAALATLPGLPKYKTLELNKKLRSYQVSGAGFLALRSWAMICDPMRCVSGDTEIAINRGKSARRMTIAQLVFKLTGGKTGGKRWRRDIDTFTQSYDETTHSFYLNKITAAHRAGVKQSCVIEMSGERSITTSLEHKFITRHKISGAIRWVTANDILHAPNDFQVLSHEKPQPKKRHPAQVPPRTAAMWNHPFATRSNYNRRTAGRSPVEKMARVFTHRLVAEAAINNISFEDFITRIKSGTVAGLTFIDPKLFHVHHINRDRSDNSPENLEILSAKEHLRLHGLERRCKGMRDEPVWMDVIKATKAGPCEMYDLTMEDPRNNYIANGFVVHNSGKTLTALAGAVLSGSQKTLIVCPALPKLGWAEEIARWVDEEAVVLEGRAGSVARRFCKTCMGRGKIDGAHCDACKLKNGQSNGLKLFKSKAESVAAIDAAKYVIVNYDLLVGQQAKDGAGRAYSRDDLPGWVPNLNRYKFDICLLDECHLIRGFSTNQNRRGQTRRERVCALTAPIDRVWGITGTPMFGFVRDYWGQLDCISGGACSSREDRLPFTFHVRYCDGQKGEYGWISNGITPCAETELPRRLSQFTVKRDRRDILPFMPPKIRQIHRIEGDMRLPQVRRALRGRTSAAEKTKKLMDFSARVKAPYVIENVIAEMMEGQKCMVVCFSPDTVKLYKKELEAAASKKDVRTCMAAVDFKAWAAHGGVNTDARFKMGKSFREHQGAGAFLMTIDAFQVGVSLLGASTEHWVDLHHDPAAVLQAEDRAYEPGVTGLTIVYYVLKGSIDEHRENIILPKVEALARVQSDADAANLQSILGTKEESAHSLEAMLDSLTADLDEDFWEEYV